MEKPLLPKWIKMKKEEEKLDGLFEEAVEKATKTKEKLAPDVRLSFYAYYKRAKGINSVSNKGILENEPLVNAFKMNALFQLGQITPGEAKKKYIELVNQHIPDNINA